MIFKGQPLHYKHKDGMPIAKGVDLLNLVETSRRWMEVPASKINLKGGQVKVGRQKVGELSPFAFQQLRRQVKARKHQLMGIPKFKSAVEEGDTEMVQSIHQDIVSERLRDLDKPMYLRVQDRDKAQPLVMTALTKKYEHLPYPQLLEAVPKGMRVSRIHIDMKFLSVHVTESKFIMAGLKAGFRITSSDIGASKIKMAFQLFRLVCTNGLMLPETIFDFKKKHANGALKQWGDFLLDCKRNVPKFKADIQRMLKQSEKKKLTVESATDELLELNIPRKRIERALVIAKEEFGQLNRWSVANGLTQSSHENRPGNVPVAISTGNLYDQAAVQLMRG